MKSKSVRVLLAAAATGVALTACSSPTPIGVAATVGGERISTKQLDAEVTEFQTALAKAKVTQEQIQLPSIPRAVLLQLVYFKQFDQFAERNGVNVTEGDVDSFVAEQGGMERIGPAALSKGVPPSETRQWIRTALIYQKGLERFGANLSDQASSQAAQVKVFEQMDAIPVKVAHRYGVWDPQQGLVNQPRFGAPAEQDAPPAGQPDPSAGQ
ncbi:SurA N-terminal domain-containing protein [Sphaerisporangium sp. TRM90804]|uniref:SurA N-terminal domain-containing protein n=1 Tax=Sphaerisporangium sp. TRM90804 TaxID=3031113 RepID=UPI002448E3A9|nr:SurA N-terminal domain-containing protein [Sphaerisporangium sp. TRM90804]MDH2428763.1 SurA N-terminal domain-containing protein [Sphaerisporangium sp. TRM90804]